MSQSRFSVGFGGFLFGIVFGLAVAAAVAVFTLNSPVPFVEKVQKVTADVDPAKALEGNVDPNKALNAASSPDASAAAPAGTVATVTAPNAPVSNSVTPAEQQAAPAELQPVRDGQGKAAQPGTVTPVTYWVQAGAFKSAKQAEERQAQLAMLAVEAQVQQAGNIWRVRVGPFDDRNSANEIQNMLNDQSIQATIVKQQN